MEVAPPNRDEARREGLSSPTKPVSWQGRVTDPTDFSELPFRLGDAYPELRRLLHLHIPKTGGTSFDSILCRTRETLPAPIHQDLLPLALNLMGVDAGTLDEPDDLIAKYIESTNAFLARETIRWLLPITHIQLLEAILLAREYRDVLFCLLRHPREQARSMLRYRIMLALHYPDSPTSSGLPSALGVTSADFLRLATASDPGLFRAILEFESEQHCPLGFSPWLCLPGQAKSCEGMLASIVAHRIHCATAPTMASMAQCLTGLGGSAAAQIHLNRTDDLIASGVNLHIGDNVITPFVEDSSMELFHRLQESGVFDVWAEPTPTSDEYWRRIDQALKVTAASARPGCFQQFGTNADPVPPSPSLARLKLFQDLTKKAQERDGLVHSRIWRATAPYRRFRDWLTRLLWRKGQRAS